jgi:hypothetical protein
MWIAIGEIIILAIIVTVGVIGYRRYYSGR